MIYKFSIFNFQFEMKPKLLNLKLNKNFKFQISNFRAGFTLIELIVVLSVAAVISLIGIAAFVSYSQTQSLNTAAADISNMFSLAKSRAASGVKPTTCSGSLDGYEIRLCGFTGSTCINSTSASYELDIRCNGSIASPPILTGKLPSNIIFILLTSSTTFSFPVLTGGFSQTGSSLSPPWPIYLSGFGKNKTIWVDYLGNAR